VAESKGITGIVLPGLCPETARVNSRGNVIAIDSASSKDSRSERVALLEKFEIYRLAIVKNPACRELATVDYHGFGGHPSACRLCCHI
jgi:hypothetical protein